MTTIVQDVMTRPVHTIGPHESVERARAMMRELDIRHLVVMDGTHIVGVAPCLDYVVDDLAHSHVTAAPPDMTLAAAAKLMRSQRIGCLPVVDGAALVGIVTVSDVLAHVGHESTTSPGA